MDDFTPQAHHIELYEQTLDGNRIICLPTGAGKTLIAILLIKKLNQNVWLPYSKGGKRTIFISNTEPLVTQQCAYIARHTDLRCQAYSGDMNVDFWTEIVWKGNFELNQVLVMTAQIFLEILRQGFMTLERVNLIIFDECHRAVKNHPIRQIMKLFETCPKNKQPKILGLTATLSNSSDETEKLEDVVHDLEVTFNAKVITASSTASDSDCEKTSEDQVIYKKSGGTPIYGEIEEILNDMKLLVDGILLNSATPDLKSKKRFKPKFIIRQLSVLNEEVKEYITNQGLYGCNLLVNLRRNQLLKSKLLEKNIKITDKVSFLNAQMAVISKLIENEMNRETYLSEYEKIMSNSSNKMLKLFDLIKSQYDKSEEIEKFRCIIFVSSQISATVLCQILKSLKNSSEHFEFLEPRYGVGNSKDPCENLDRLFMKAKWNKAAIKNFNMGKSNCLIATDIVDEIVDIIECSLIVRFDPPLDFRSYVQSKGRMGLSHSRYVTFIEENDDTMRDTYANWKKAELSLEEYVIGTDDEKVKPSPDDKTKNSLGMEIPPYIVTCADGTQSILTDVTAVILLTKYCSTYKASKNIVSKPTIEVHQIQSENCNRMNFWVSLVLPKKSPLQETIKGDVMTSIVLAKRSAAMKACIALHKLGEINDKLIPRGPGEMMMMRESLVLKNSTEKSDEKSSEVNGVVGESHLIFAESFFSAQPMPNCKAYLHIIEVEPTASDAFQNRHWVFYNYLKEKAGFAILSSKKLPVLPSFDIFVSIGLVNVGVRINDSQVILSANEISKLKKFHWVIFNDILEMVRKFSVFDNDNNDNSFLVVPVDVNRKINWELVEKYEEIVPIPANKPVKKETTTDFLIQIFSPSPSSEPETFIPLFKTMSDDEWQVVIPRYRSSHEFYIVTKVCNDMSPLSPFPSSELMSYSDYYKQKYKLTTDPNQPLLEVKPVTRDLDFILPRKHIKPVVENEKNLKHRNANSVIYFIPELCNIVTFPAMYWLKAITLPTILHRITLLLIADDLRRKINSETGLGRIDVDSWPPLKFQPHEERKNVKNESFNNNESTTIKQDTNINSSTIDEQQFINFMEEREQNNLIDYESKESIQNNLYENFIDFGSTRITLDQKNSNEDEGSDAESVNLIEFSDDESELEEKSEITNTNMKIDPPRLDSIDFLLSNEKSNYPFSIDKKLDTIESIEEDFYDKFGMKLSFADDEIILAKLQNPGFSKRLHVVPPTLGILHVDVGVSDGPSPADILSSMTTAMANDHFDLERLETLGDSFLKFITSTYLAERYPNVGEGRLTMCKGQIVGNQNLFVRGKSKNIPGRLKVEPFVPRVNFMAPSYCVPRNHQHMLVEQGTATTILHELHVSKEEQKSGQLSRESEQNHIIKILHWQEKRINRGKTGTDNFIGVQTVKDKCVADCVEALTGTYLKHTGIDGATELLKWFQVLPSELDIKQVLSGPSADPRLDDGDPIEHMPWMNFIKNTIGYEFKDPIYLLQAVTHASFTRHTITCDYQRLEFLGDAVIDFLITIYIFEHCGKLTPGDLTDLRSALVNNITFACLTVKYGLHIALLHSCPHIADSIEKFENFQMERDYIVNDNLFWILLEEDDYNMAEYLDVPKILGDIFEAIIGAIYLDTGKDLNQVWNILYGLMKNEIDCFSKNVPKQPVREIFEKPGVLPKFMKFEEVDGKMLMIPLRIHVPDGIKLFHGFGATKAHAKRAAAKHALKYLAKQKESSDAESSILKFE